MYEPATKENITKRAKKFYGNDGIAYNFVELGRYYGCFVETETGLVSVNMKAAARACGFERTTVLNSYNMMEEFWPNEKAGSVVRRIA